MIVALLSIVLHFTMTTAKKKAKAPTHAKKVASHKKPASIVEEVIEHQIGIRELRQDASRVIALVESGASITITKHGKVVATINPPRKSKLDLLVERGSITPAAKNFVLRNWKPDKKYDGTDLLQILLKEREEAHS
jgi:prevent-host-death family protein